jgi:hypothetical protein
MVLKNIYSMMELKLGVRIHNKKFNIQNLNHFDIFIIGKVCSFMFLNI